MPYARLADETRIYYELTGPKDGPLVIQFGGGLFGRQPGRTCTGAPSSVSGVAWPSRCRGTTSPTT